VTQKSYNFDRIFGMQSSNSEVYNRAATRVVDVSLRGVNGTVFAYGQTGSGKTHSMLGNSRDPGIIPRAIHDVFKYVEEQSRHGSEFLVRVSYLEVYNEEINDLLQQVGRGRGHNLRILSDDPQRGALIEGLTEEICVSRVQVLEAVARGESNRSYGATAVHAGSSRSHTIFRMVIESKLPDLTSPSSAGTGDSSPGQRFSSTNDPEASAGIVRVSYLNLVDLAGSERQEYASTSGERLKEGIHINKSLSTLSLVISKLAEQSRKARRAEKSSSSAQKGGNVTDDDAASLASADTGLHLGRTMGRAGTGTGTGSKQRQPSRASSLSSAASVDSGPAPGKGQGAGALLPPSASARKRKAGSSGPQSFGSGRDRPALSHRHHSCRRCSAEGRAHSLQEQ
jgi:hypothetical protein